MVSRQNVEGALAFEDVPLAETDRDRRGSALVSVSSVTQPESSSMLN